MTDQRRKRSGRAGARTNARPPAPDEALRRQNLGRLLIRAFNAFETYHIDRLNVSGFDDLTPSDTVVLRNVETGGSRISEIARRGKVTPQAISQLVAGLERRGYVTTVTDPADGRARLVRLTRRGLALIARGQAITRDLNDAWAEILGAEGFTELRRLLIQLVSTLDADDEGLG